jgi:phosphate starvation-inducible protein PhoH and related proteins
LREAIITIDTINPIEFFGVNDINLEILRKKFPDLKLIARGNEIKLAGSDKLIHQFNEKVHLLIDHFKRFGNLDENAVIQLLSVAREETIAEVSPSSPDVLVYGPNGLMVRARTTNQRKMVESSEKNDVVFAIGPAGTGKTYTAVALAVRALKNRQIKKIVLTRPAVEAGENLGFLPGDLKEKIDPYLRPLYDALYDMIPGDKVKTYIDNGIIEIAPLAFMRGRTLDNSFVILDEAQNATESQLKMFLTRMGPSAKFIVTGDATQVDLPRHQPSGLIQAMKILPSVKGIDFIYLDALDVVRHRLVKEIIQAYHNDNNR